MAERKVFYAILDANGEVKRLRGRGRAPHFYQNEKMAIHYAKRPGDSVVRLHFNPNEEPVYINKQVL